MASEVKTNKVSPSTGSTTEVTGLITSTSDVQGDVLYHDGTNFTRLGAGTSGHFLKTQGTSADPVWAAAGGGGMLQVKSGVKTDSYTSTNTGPTDWKSPGLSVVITPTLNTSKILVIGYCVTGAIAGYENAVRWVRTISGGSAVYLNIADTSGSMTSATTMMRINSGAKDAANASFMFLDTPATTTATTYHVEISVEATASDVFFNRTAGESDIAGDYRGSSSITVMEIAVGVL